MHFEHVPQIWHDFPSLAAAALYVEGISPDVSVDAVVSEYSTVAAGRLAGAIESDFAEIKAWRRAFGAMGLKPTQYRCAAESLLRRYRKDGLLPHVQPLVDACNAISLAFAIPIAAFDVGRISGDLHVRYAAGDEFYEAFSGALEHPAAGEVVFADTGGRVHARRWTNRQSASSAIRDTTQTAFIVAEALHPAANTDVGRVLRALSGAVQAVWGAPARGAVLSATAPRFMLR